MDFRKLQIDYSRGKHVTRDAEYKALNEYWCKKNSVAKQIESAEKKINTVQIYTEPYPGSHQVECTMMDICSGYSLELLKIPTDRDNKACSDANSIIRSMLNALNFNYVYSSSSYIFNNILGLTIKFDVQDDGILHLMKMPILYVELDDSTSELTEHKNHFLTYMRSELKMHKFVNDINYGISLQLNYVEQLCKLLKFIKKYLDEYTEHSFVDYLLNNTRANFDEKSLYRKIPTATQIEMDPLAYVSFKLCSEEDSWYGGHYYYHTETIVQNYAKRLI